MTFCSLSFESVRSIVLPHLIANRPICLIGSPGIGKTAIAFGLGELLGEALGRPAFPVLSLIASTMDPTDPGGFPVVRKDGAFDRIPCRAFQRAALEPCIIFLDEITTASPGVQNALLDGIWRRVFGDTTLHPETRFVAAANPVSQVGGGSELNPALVGRFAIYDFRPKLDEVRDYFFGLGEDDSPLRSLALDWAATTQHEVGLIQLDPPAAALVETQKWASPRDWECGLRVCAAVPPAQLTDSLMSDLLAGNVGQNAADAFVGIRKLRVHLPSVDEVTKDPQGAKVPAKMDYQIGALGVLANVAQRDFWAAWLYADRLLPEIRSAIARVLLKNAKYKANSPAKFAKEGKKTMVRVIGEIGGNL